MSDTKINLLDLSPLKLTELMQKLGEPTYRVNQIIKWLHQQRVSQVDQMTNLSKALREKLNLCGEIRPLAVALESEARDGTCKWLFRLHDGNCIETVFIPERTRGTLCVSSQVGCALNCSFCSTGKEGFNRNLSLGEIIGQLRLALIRLTALGCKNKHIITNVVMMGMGEPLLNYQSVVDAMDLMMSDHAYGLSKYRVTLSTSGVIPKMQQLQQDSACALAVSLHAPNDELRNQLVPLNKKYPLSELIPLCKNYYTEKKREVMFEYVMLDGVNDTLVHAKQLIKLLKDVPCKINLIPFNPFPKTHYKTSSLEQIRAFQEKLMAAGFNARVRKTRGDDIDAACGQLAGQIKDRTGRHARWQQTGKLIPVVVE